MTSYTGAHLELVHPNGSSEGSLHNTTEVTFTNLTPATNYTLRVTFLFAGDFTSLSVVEGATGEDSKSHDKSHDESHDVLHPPTPSVVVGPLAAHVYMFSTMFVILQVILYVSGVMPTENDIPSSCDNK